MFFRAYIIKCIFHGPVEIISKNINSNEEQEWNIYFQNIVLFKLMVYSLIGIIMGKQLCNGLRAHK